MKTAFAALAIVLGSQGLVSAQTTGSATANGQCSLANTGHNNTNITINCGIGREQGQKIIELLNEALKSKDIATINAKLDSLLIAVSKPDQNQTCIGSNCVQDGTQNNYDNRTYGVPKPLPSVVGISQSPIAAVPRPAADDPKPFRGIPNADDKYSPGVVVNFTVNAPFSNPMFVFLCDRPCRGAGIAFNGSYAGSWPPFIRTANPRIWVSTYGSQNLLPPGMQVTADFRSLDDLPVSVLRIEAYAP
jgi:hypothetical protein